MVAAPGMFGAEGRLVMLREFVLGLVGETGKSGWSWGEAALRVFYETAGFVNVFVFVFSLFGVFVLAFDFVLAVAFWGAAKWLLRRIHLGLLYALVEGRNGPGAGWCPMKMNWGCHLKDGL